ncbi:MAG: hypothetical protein IJX45_09740 [Spirochaetaceae bacterium]|nr:hypothetical protein [Spirochaetaceae bacterium]MBQ8561322.1 hypothetical protein [Spirochaetaceae bacterium]
MAGDSEYLPDFINNATGGRVVDVLAFSQYGDYVAEHYADSGEIGMHFRLRYTSELLSRQVEFVSTPVYSMAFSDDKELLATAGGDGVVRVWSTFSGRSLYELSQHPQSSVPIHYIKGTYNLLVSRGERELAVIDPTGTELSVIEAAAAVMYAKPLSDRRRVAVLTAEKRLELYNLEDGEYLGYVPSYNVTAMTSFAFNADDSQLLMGHEDGSIYLVDLESALVPPRRRPVLRIIGEEEVVERGTEFTESIPPAEYADMEEVFHSPLEAMDVLHRGLFPEPRHGIELLAGVSLLPNPHVLDLDITVGYLNAIWLHPFYVGAQLRWSVGWPQKDFPYNYRLYGETLAPPMMMSVELDFPVGIVVTPFSVNRDIELYAEVGAGVSLHQLWNRRFGKTAIAGELHPAFVASMAVGAGWRGLSLKLHGDYNTQLGFLFSVNVGYIFQLPYKSAVSAAAQFIEESESDDGEAAAEPVLELGEGIEEAHYAEGEE